MLLDHAMCGLIGVIYQCLNMALQVIMHNWDLEEDCEELVQMNTSDQTDMSLIS